jgi:GTP-binding protein
MKINSSRFVCSAPHLKNCPPAEFPEFAFIGRSNVGKSSLINLLSGRKELAKVSATPGKTKLINFFLINEQWCLVDLPGYGYAKVAQDKRVDFNQSTALYLSQRSSLKFIFVLIDSRLSPQSLDLDFIGWAGSHELPLALVFTKVDKLSPAKIKENVALFLESIEGTVPAQPPVFLSSSAKGQGKQELLGFIGECVRSHP